MEWTASRIDELFSRIEAGERAIAAARAGLKRYRKSILKAAVTGTLTADWREQSPAGTRRAEARTQRSDSQESRRKPASEPNVTRPSGLPDDWSWTSVDGVAIRVTDGTHAAPKQTQQGIPFVVIGNVSEGMIHWEAVSKWVSVEEFELHTRHIRPQAGDVLYTAVGSYGLALALTDDRPFLIQRHIAHIRPNDRVIPSFLAIALNSPQTRQQANDQARGVAQKTVTLGSLSRFGLPVPPRDEQAEIISRVEEALSRADHAQATLDAQARNARALKQAILKSAFEGRLIPQDLNDEPAADMLARIAGETPAPKAKTKARA